MSGAMGRGGGAGCNCWWTAENRRGGKATDVELELLSAGSGEGRGNPA